MRGRKVKQKSRFKGKVAWLGQLSTKRKEQPSRWPFWFMKRGGAEGEGIHGGRKVGNQCSGLGLHRAVWRSSVEWLIMGCWMATNADCWEMYRKGLQDSPAAGIARPSSCACPGCISSSVLPLTSSQHRSCLSQQLEIPLSECNCISAKRPQSRWIIWHHRPWWIISDHMPWKTHIPY